MDEHAFVSGIETWGSGGEVLDVIELRDGRVLVIGEARIALFPSRADFDSGTGAVTLTSASAHPLRVANPAPGARRLRAVPSGSP